MNRFAAKSIATSAAIGLLLVYATDAGLALCVLMPPLCFWQKNRLAAFFVALGYYGSASTILIPGAMSFFGDDATLPFALTLWAIASTLLAVPFAALWSCDRYSASWRAPVAILASVPPPLGIIGWANPLTSAGILFPGTGWFGLLAVLIFAVWSTRLPRASIVALAGAAIITNVVYPGTANPPPDWEAVNTTLGNTSVEPQDPLQQFRIARFIQHRALESRARVIVFPETMVPSWTEATDLFWDRTVTALALQGKSVLLGALMNIEGTERHRNVMVIRGATSAEFSQRIPVPVAMWEPLSNRGVSLNLKGPGSVQIGGRQVAPLICYEQILTWPVFRSMMSRPDIIVAISNHHWAHRTRIPAVQRSTFLAWIRLFNVPYVSAANS